MIDDDYDADFVKTCMIGLYVSGFPSPAKVGLSDDDEKAKKTLQI